MSSTIQFEALDHEGENIVPGFEDEVAQQGFQILKKGLGSSQSLAKGGVVLIDQIDNGMKQESQQGSQMLTSLPEVVLDLITRGLEHVIILAFDLSAGASISHISFDRGIRDCKIGEEGVSIDHCACVFTREGQFTPVDFPRRLVSPYSYKVMCESGLHTRIKCMCLSCNA